MKENMELERKDIRVDRDIQIDSENKLHIVAYLETLFDVNKKFNLQLDSEAGDWVNMYGIYNPASDFLTIECVICKDDSSKSFFYTPTKEEAKLIKDMIAEKIQEVHGQTPVEFVCDLTKQQEKVYVYQNTANLSAEQTVAKHKRISKHCEECGYYREGSISISAPMVRCGKEFQNMIDYCQAHGISKIVVDSLYDIGDSPAEVNKAVGYLCGHRLEVEAITNGLTFAPKETGSQMEEKEDQGITMGGM